MTQETCVVIADGARARFFKYPGAVDSDGVSQRLVETQSLTCPSRRVRSGELQSETRPGLQASGTSAHAVDDHRDQHRQELERRFAVDVATAIAESCSDGQRLILFAAPSFLGTLRPALSRHQALDSQKNTIVEQGLDLTKLTSSELHDRLTSEELLPTRRVVPT